MATRPNIRAVAAQAVTAALDTWVQALTDVELAAELDVAFEGRTGGDVDRPAVVVAREAARRLRAV